MTINSVNSNTQPLTLNTTSVDGSGTQTQANGVVAVDPAKLLADLLNTVAQIASQGKDGKDAGRPGPKGAPALEQPTMEFSADQMSLLLGALQTKSAEMQLATAKEGIKISADQKKAAHNDAINKLMEAAQKIAEAIEKQKANKILGWFTKIFSFVASLVAVIAAAVATVATGGAAAPLLALACMGLAATTMDLANAISKECGGPDISISGLMTQGMTKMLEAFGVDKEKAEQLGKVLAGAVALVVAPGAAAIMAPDLIGNMVGGIAELCGCDKQTAQYIAMGVTMAVQLAVAVAMIAATGGAGAGAAVSGAARVAQNIGKITSIVAQGVGGALNVAQGGIKIDVAMVQRDAENAKADKADIDKLILKLQKMMEDDQERVKEVVQQLEESMQLVSQMINSTASANVQTVRNFA
ncbi:type III secretion system translocon subunit SctE [Parachitinimonas caeni]|uniref:Type III secretion system translocon subunit SctE n=1 Tax=Parachitinimonas caeni TaxID=3031301 RepID=A0ABT7DUJ5_9NEIS|nr:type III secretion system translocon subunit SctE [Parachitinimonas caeni]MDK2123489.1 type III secretion system translocon subunit SctE [Parachitinimonas caeni]